MIEQVLVEDYDDDGFYIPDANLLVTEDDTPVDNFAFAKQQRLLVATLYSSFRNQLFLAAANVGVYYTDLKPPIVPDVFLSLDAKLPENLWEKNNRCYMIWRFGKPPDVAIEIVSNKKGNELGKKLEIYQQMRVSYYVVYDPTQKLGEKQLRIYKLNPLFYSETSDNWLEQVGLGLTIWTGEFEGRQDTWLRWCYQDGTVLLTGDEKASQAQQGAENAEQRFEEAQQRIELLAERLRAMGIDPDSL